MNPKPPLPADDRLLDLLTEQATLGLDEQHAGELRVLLSRFGLAEEEASLDKCASAYALAFLGSQGLMDPPPSLLAKVHSAGRDWCQSVRDQRADQASKPAPSPLTFPPAAPVMVLPARGMPRWAPWLAAAAGITLAAIAWLPTVLNTKPTNPVATVSDDPGAVRLAWRDWDSPEQPGVTGEVVWSESKQSGYMKFVGLKPNDPAQEQYQLWIIDSRGMEQRISGAIFNASAGETIVPIKPGIDVKQAAAFALTIEKPGGVWVSDMKRRVVIAAKKS